MLTLAQLLKVVPVQEMCFCTYLRQLPIRSEHLDLVNGFLRYKFFQTLQRSAFLHIPNVDGGYPPWVTLVNFMVDVWVFFRIVANQNEAFFRIGIKNTDDAFHFVVHVFPTMDFVWKANIPQQNRRFGHGMDLEVTSNKVVNVAGTIGNIKKWQKALVIISPAQGPEKSGYFIKQFAPMDTFEQGIVKSAPFEQAGHSGFDYRIIQIRNDAKGTLLGGNHHGCTGLEVKLLSPGCFE